MINPYSMYLNIRFVDEMLHSFTLCAPGPQFCAVPGFRGGTPPLFVELGAHCSSFGCRINLALTGQCFWAVRWASSYPAKYYLLILLGPNIRFDNASIPIRQKWQMMANAKTCSLFFGSNTV